MNLFANFECGNAKNVRRLSDRHYRLEAVADNAHYGYYFQFAARNPGETTHVRIDVHADSAVAEAARAFRSHMPYQLWLRHANAPGWASIPVLRCDESVRIELMLEAKEAVVVSRTLPFPQSSIDQWLTDFLAGHEREVERISLGKSVEGRDLAGLRFAATRQGARRIVVFAGQHPAEFAGVRAVRGVAEFLASSLKEAREAREHFEFALFPTVNPDGNVEGKSALNAEGADLYRAFEGCAKNRKPSAHEARLLWRWLKKNPPAATLNFHSYVVIAPGGDSPWEGAYAPDPGAFPDAGSRERQQVVNDHLRFKTDALSQHRQFATHHPGSVEHNLAQLGTVGVLYEVQDAVGAHRNYHTGVRVIHALTQALLAAG